MKPFIWTVLLITLFCGNICLALSNYMQYNNSMFFYTQDKHLVRYDFEIKGSATKNNSNNYDNNVDNNYNIFFLSEPPSNSEIVFVNYDSPIAYAFYNNNNNNNGYDLKISLLNLLDSTAVWTDVLIESPARYCKNAQYFYSTEDNLIHIFGGICGSNNEVSSSFYSFNIVNHTINTINLLNSPVPLYNGVALSISNDNSNDKNDIGLILAGKSKNAWISMSQAAFFENSQWVYRSIPFNSLNKLTLDSREGAIPLKLNNSAILLIGGVVGDDSHPAFPSVLYLSRSSKSDWVYNNEVILPHFYHNLSSYNALSVLDNGLILAMNFNNPNDAILSDQAFSKDENGNYNQNIIGKNINNSKNKNKNKNMLKNFLLIDSSNGKTIDSLSDIYKETDTSKSNCSQTANTNNLEKTEKNKKIKKILLIVLLPFGIITSLIGFVIVLKFKSKQNNTFYLSSDEEKNLFDKFNLLSYIKKLSPSSLLFCLRRNKMSSRNKTCSKINSGISYLDDSFYEDGFENDQFYNDKRNSLTANQVLSDFPNSSYFRGDLVQLESSHNALTTDTCTVKETTSEHILENTNPFESSNNDSIHTSPLALPGYLYSSTLPLRIKKKSITVRNQILSNELNEQNDELKYFQNNTPASSVYSIRDIGNNDSSFNGNFSSNDEKSASSKSNEGISCFNEKENRSPLRVVNVCDF